jgi:murein DD-endopeptidase MepM/ murein hydrolase activator NlpD
LAKIKVKKGDIVSEGQVIGKMGRTGRVKGAHLHYEISVNGKSQNPINFIKIGRNLLSRTSIKGFANIE